MAEREPIQYYKKNVPYTIGIRYYIGDNEGKALTDADPYVGVNVSDLRDFKRANTHHLKSGLLIETTEPNYDIETPNAIDDEKATAIVKNIFSLKKALKEVDSPDAVLKLLNTAKALDRPGKTIKLIEDRLAEMGEESPFAMQGVEN